jgi:muramidase (phage lysozyme)
MLEKTVRSLHGAEVQMIRAMIQEAESRKDGYDAVQHGARIKPPKRPTQMTLAEVFAWIDATPGQPHAIGLYQFIPETLRRVVAKTGVKLSQRFGPQVQDQLADVLLAEAGLHKFLAGQLERKGFMNNMAKIWAGLPNSNGKSHYDGYAGNKAAVTWARFDAVMAQISPERG